MESRTAAIFMGIPCRLNAWISQSRLRPVEGKAVIKATKVVAVFSSIKYIS